MAAARRQQEYVPLSLDYTIVPGEPIYLVDVDGTLIKESKRLNDGLVAFLRGKPNVFLFTKMSHDTVMIGVKNIQEVFGSTPLLIRYNLINTLLAKGVTIQGVITPGDVKRSSNSETGSVPGAYYVDYLGKLEYDNYVKGPSDNSALSPEEGAEEQREYDDNQELKNEMYKMAKNYFSLVYRHKGPIIFIDDEYEQLIYVGLQELIEPYKDSIPLILIHVEPLVPQSQDFFTDVFNKPQPRDPLTILRQNIATIIREYFNKLSSSTQALANKKKELMAFLNAIKMRSLSIEKKPTFTILYDLINKWPEEQRLPATAFYGVAARNGVASSSLRAPSLQPGNWTCPFCTTENPGTSEVCRACQIPRNGSPTGVGGITAWQANEERRASEAEERNRRLVKLNPGQWICPKCTTINEKDANRCISCDAIKQTQTPSEWDCSQCTFKNPSGSKNCEMCETPRTGGGKKYKSKNKTKTKKTLKSKKSIKKMKKTKKSKKISKKISKK